ncbi:hypothetical protein Sinac_4342 [Singulisphaera acidiphila DSM 18658]|uniref:Uncharacterized protein n=1 Tax=Singulisphaera acidiphila (strain ATCC BAA-1392 / DSM 18658 / VKM B-2454 / MOB10) TaxID=886293 RepID=L0DGN3_SINAD|nr:hypothetical protein Sinac_4342 [Singulisphaera acidiphila DSM 18658]
MITDAPEQTGLAIGDDLGNSQRQAGNQPQGPRGAGQAVSGLPLSLFA